MSDDFDLARLPHEITRSMDKDYDLIPEQVEPGLTMRVDEEADVVHVTERTGRQVAVVPRYRLRAVNEDMLLAAALEDERTGDADQIKAAIRDGHVEARPDCDYVDIETGPGRKLRVSRALCVPTWPHDADDDGTRLP